MEIGKAYAVPVGYAYGPHACGSKLEGGRGPQSSGAYDQHLAAEQFLLPLFAYLFQENVTAVSL